MNIPWTLTPAGVGEPLSTPGSYALFRAELDLVVAFRVPQTSADQRTHGANAEAHFSIE